MTWTAGELVAGKYRLERPLGEGGMGTVWRAQHVGLGQPVALKTVDAHGANASAGARRFVREAKVAAAVRHRNVVYVSDCGESDDGSPYLAMELLEGQTLFDRLLSGPRLRVGGLVDIAVGCLNGLAAVHAAGIVHRDVKPQNVFLVVDAEGAYPKLLDFGLSRAAEPDDGAIVGTLAYMAPEQARGARDLDARADLYALGAMLYEALTGEPPFTASTRADLLVALLEQPLVPLAIARPDLGRPLSEVLSRSLAREPAERFASAREMREALVLALEQSPNAADLLLPETFELLARHATVGVASEAPAAPHAPRPRANRVAGIVAVGAVAALLGGLGWASVAWPVPAPPATGTSRVHVQLVGVPEGAEVRLDGEPVDADAPIAMDGDGRVRAIEVRAPGHLPWRIGHPAIADARYDVSLEPLVASSERDAGVPLAVTTLRDAARAAFAAGHYEDAARAYDEATRLSPSEAGLWAGLGAARLRASDARGAVDAYRRAITIDEHAARYQVALGRALLGVGDPDGARAAFEQALVLEPANADARAQLAQP